MPDQASSEDSGMNISDRLGLDVIFQEEESAEHLSLDM